MSLKEMGITRSLMYSRLLGSGSYSDILCPFPVMTDCTSQGRNTSAHAVLTDFFPELLPFPWFSDSDRLHLLCFALERCYELQ